MPTPSEPGAGPRVLVVEDEALIAEEIQERLTRLGHQVVGLCDTAEEAIQAATRLRPDVVLMDIRLKGPTDGIDAAHHIYRTLHLPVVYLSAHSDQATLERAKATAPFAYLLKPFHERDLLVAIEMATSRHQLELRLQASEQLYATTLMSIGDGVIATDANGQVTFMNPVAEAITQWPFAEARGLHIEQVVPVVAEATQAPRESPVLEAIRRKATVTLTEPALTLTRQGEPVPIDDSAAPITGARGELVGGVFAFRDIRQRRLTEQALKQAADHLRQAQKMEAIGQLAGGVAHDFNNLLTVILGSCEMILTDGRVDEMSRGLLGHIKHAGERAADLTRQLLAFGRKQILQPTTVQLGSLVAQVSRLLGRLIGEDIVQVVTSAPDLWPIQADQGQLEQILMNLAVNARDAMPGGGCLTLETSNIQLTERITQARPEMPPGRYVLLAVSDTGIGMDQATQERIFEPFFTTKALGKGTGLGLATVYGIVKQSNGFIYVYSELGKGSTFKIYFPAADAVAPQMSVAEGGQSKTGTETILVVEDDDAVRSMTTTALRGLGYTVHEARDGEEALRLFSEHAGSIQLLLSDVIMPGMSGRELADRIVARGPHVRVLFFSGYTNDAVLRHGIIRGKSAFLDKPFSVYSLAQKIREVLDQSGGHNDEAARSDSRAKETSSGS